MPPLEGPEAIERLHEKNLSWPDLSAYGIELVWGLMPEGEAPIVVRALRDIPEEDRAAAVDRHAAALEAVGFVRDANGLLIQPQGIVSPVEVKEQFPEMTIVKKSWFETTADMRDPENGDTSYTGLSLSR